MKFVHLSDLHIGKRLRGYSMIDDQRYITERIIEIIGQERPDGIIIAGDLYDKSVPSEEAVRICDDFLVKLSKFSAETYIISGNHDSAERLSFGGRLIDASGIHISGVYDGSICKHRLKDEYGIVNIYMLPFIKPQNVRRVFPETQITSYTEAMKVAISNMNMDTRERNILITHQFVTGAIRSESEEISVGGSDNVDVSVFEDFDYVALGHIHRAQKVGDERIRYCGTPLKYSLSEAKGNKSVTVVEVLEKGKIKIKCIPLKPLHDLIALKGKYIELTSKSFYENTSYREDYVHITLTDEEDITDAATKLGVIYKRLMGISYDNNRTRNNLEVIADTAIEAKPPLQLFGEFYKLRNNEDLKPEQAEYMQKIIDEVWEGEK